VEHVGHGDGANDREPPHRLPHEWKRHRQRNAQCRQDIRTLHPRFHLLAPRPPRTLHPEWTSNSSSKPPSSRISTTASWPECRKCAVSRSSLSASTCSRKGSRATVSSLLP